MLRPGGSEAQSVVPAHYARIVRQTFDLKLTAEFGVALNRSELSSVEFSAVKAYQRAYNHIQAEEAARLRAQSGGH